MLSMIVSVDTVMIRNGAHLRMVYTIQRRPFDVRHRSDGRDIRCVMRQEPELPQRLGVFYPYREMPKTLAQVHTCSSAHFKKVESYIHFIDIVIHYIDRKLRCP